MDESQELLACPFCGSQAKLNQDFGSYKVECEFSGACYGNWQHKFSTRRAAINRWNLRAGAGGALNDNRGERLAPASWLDALETALRNVREKREYAISPDTKARFAMHEAVLSKAIAAVRSRASNIVISRIFSAYFLGLPLISAANAEERWAFFGGSSGENRRFCGRRKAIFRASAAATQVARPCPRCAASESLFWPDRRGIRGLDSSLYPLSQ